MKKGKDEVKFEVKLKEFFHILEADPTCSNRSVAADMEIFKKTLKRHYNQYLNSGLSLRDWKADIHFGRPKILNESQPLSPCTCGFPATCQTLYLEWHVTHNLPNMPFWGHLIDLVIKGCEASCEIYWSIQKKLFFLIHLHTWQWSQMFQEQLNNCFSIITMASLSMFFLLLDWYASDIIFPTLGFEDLDEDRATDDDFAVFLISLCNSKWPYDLERPYLHSSSLPIGSINQFAQGADSSYLKLVTHMDRPTFSLLLLPFESHYQFTLTLCETKGRKSSQKLACIWVALHFLVHAPSLCSLCLMTGCVMSTTSRYLPSLWRYCWEY
jgi:hypothetical protein